MKWLKTQKDLRDLERRNLQLLYERDELNLHIAYLRTSMNNMAEAYNRDVDAGKEMVDGYKKEIRNLADKIGRVQDIDPSSPGHSSDLSVIRISLLRIIGEEDRLLLEKDS